MVSEWSTDTPNEETQSPVQERELLRQRLSRRTLLKAGAVAAIGAAGMGLAACGEEEGTAPPTAATAPAAATASPGPIGSPAPGSSSIVSLAGNPQAIAEVAPGTIFFPYFGNVIALLTDDGIVVIDTSLQSNGPSIVEEMRKRTDLPVHTIVYTHGHLDHVGGTEYFLKDADESGYERPRIFSHENVIPRFQRYERMAGWIQFINSVQFGVPIEPGFVPSPGPVFVYPDVTYDEHTSIEVGGETFELIHGIGETDDHTWVWVPDRNLVCVGDFFIWACPNVGNPWKVQRYARGWAEGLEAIAEKRPALLLPGHGPPIEGQDNVQTACLDVARYLRSIDDQVVERMNKGQWLEQILREVEPPADLVDKPYLQPIYGHPKFIIQGVWRQYGGWYDGDPADFFPAPTAGQSAEIVKLAGAQNVLTRARELEAAGELPLACHLVDWVGKAEPENRDARQAWRDIFQARADKEVNMMARNTFRGAVREAERHLG
jgi:glyoxylase-like metal-dependent hydrolase (beta-lactamase superfamily II)